MTWPSHSVSCTSWPQQWPYQQIRGHPHAVPICGILDSRSSPTVGFLDFHGLVICIVAAWDLHGYRVGGVMACSDTGPEAVAATIRRHGMALKLASGLQWKAVTVFTGSKVAGYQTAGLRAKTWLEQRMRVLCAIAWRLRILGLVVRVI